MKAKRKSIFHNNQTHKKLLAISQSEDNKKNIKDNKNNKKDNKNNKDNRLIKTQSEIEKEFDIRSYSEYRIKEDDSSKDYVDEDIETKMIRLVILKRKGGNVLDNINLIKKKLTKKDIENISKALNILENIDARRKIRNFFKKLKSKISIHYKKIMFIFFQQFKKIIMQIFIKKYFYMIIEHLTNYKEILNKTNNQSLLYSRQGSRKKIKKYKMPTNKNMKVELVVKKYGHKRSGIDTILEKIEKEKVKQSNISNFNNIEQKLRKTNTFNSKENHYSSKNNSQKKKFKHTNSIYKSKISKNEQSDKDSSFFSGQSPSEIGSIRKNKKKNNGSLSEVLSSNDNGSSNTTINEVIKLKESNNKENKEIKEDELYSINSEGESKESKESKENKENKEYEKLNKSKKEIDPNWMRNSVKSLHTKKLEKPESRKNLRISFKLSGLNFKQKDSKMQLFSTKDNQEEEKETKKIDISSVPENGENQENKDEDKGDEEDEEEDEDDEEEDDEEEEEEEDEDSFSYANSVKNEFKIEKNNCDDKNSLVEYDTFYKEQFLKNEVFKYDVGNIKDEETERINKEINKFDIKRKLIEKRKLKEVMELKGIDTKNLQVEINDLTEKYKELKKVTKQKIGLNLDTTQEYYNKGKFLNIYFENKQEKNVPKFALESPEDIGAQDIIDFKPLRKEELTRRYFDYCFCLEQRKKINKILVYSRYVCRYFIDNSIFNNLSLLIIVINSIIIFISDPTDTNNLENKTDNYFLIFYTLEAILKIVTFSFYTAEDAYIKDYWNILDFLVVIIGLISFIIEKSMGGTKISGLSGLKAFRILRPLKTLKRFKGLRKLVIALLASIGHLGETVIVLFFFFLVFSIGGLQMWQGFFYRRCMNINYGYFLLTKSDEYMCSFDSNCENLNSFGQIFICAKGYLNPNDGAINFDNIGNAMITVFIMVTLEGWSYIFTYVSKTFKDKIYINPIIIFFYFHAFVYIGSFYLINLFLAVTNSEFENIEKNREKLNVPKSFFQLIKSKYDKKEKKKLEKKEKEKKLKNQNNKKSDETLKELYNKVSEEAFHINKNKRNIPKVYSTVKDIYIMANNNPEELYLEKLRIKNEEKSLCLDIERQEKEIELLIKEKKIEMEKSKEKSKKNNKAKIKKTISKREENSKIEESKVTDKYKTSGIYLNNNNPSESGEDNKNISVNKISKSIIPNDVPNLELSDIIKLKDKINSTLIEISIDNTIKYFKDQIVNMTKLFTKQQEEKNKVKMKDENDNEDENINQITFFENTNFEKELDDLNKVKKEKKVVERGKRRHTRIQKFFDQSFQNKSKMRSNSKMSYFFQHGGEDGMNQINEEALINKEISFIDDLSLSSLTDSSLSNDAQGKKKYKKENTNIKYRTNNMSLTKLIIDDSKFNLNNMSLIDNNAFDINRYNRKSVNIQNTELENFNNLMDSFNDKKNIVNKKELLIDDDILIRTKFEKPHSSLNFIEKYEDEQKFNEQNIKFNLNKYLKNEAEKDNDFINKDRRKSFLGFLEYAQFQKEIKELDEMIINDKENNSNIKKNDYNQNSLYFLSEDSYLSRNNNTSVEDIDLLPEEINENRIYENEFLIHDNINKNLESNKFIKKIREEVFDRESINTNIHLKTNELKNFYERANKKLDELLYVNKRKIRIRKESNLNVSGIKKDSNFNKIIKILETNAEQELNNKSPKEEENEGEAKEKNKNNELIAQPDGLIPNGKFINSSNNSPKKSNQKYINSLSVSPKKNNQKLNEEKKNNNENNADEKKVSNNKILFDHLSNKNEQNSELPLLNKQQTMKLLNKNIKSKENQKYNIKYARSLRSNKFDNLINDSDNYLSNENGIYNKMNRNRTINKKINYFIFKAKSIDKNINKYPTENSNKFLVKEENKEYTDPLTVKQEMIPSNLRGKKYYMNYLYNIQDKDVKVKDNFLIDHWEDEVLRNKIKKIARKALPERTEAYFVFNNKKLKLKKYKYVYINDNKYDESELTYLTLKLKYLPLNVLALTPKRLRNFGKFAAKKEINNGALGCNPDSYFMSKIKTNTHQLNSYNSRSGRNKSDKIRSKGSLMMSSAFTDSFLFQDEVRLKRNVFEKIYKKIEEFNYLTLSYYFLNEEKLFFKFIDPKKREELKNNEKEKNRIKYNKLNVKNEVENIKLFDYKTNSSIYIKWSGEEILYRSDADQNKKKWNKIINSLEDFNMIIWHENSYIKNLQKLRYAFYVFAINDYFDYTILSVVMINSFFLALDGNLLKPEISNKLNIGNYVFNMIFIFEYVVKFIGLGPLVYYSDAFAYLDTVIICFGILDMATPGNTDEIVGSKKSFSSQLSFLRVFRIFRVVRLAKVLRRLKSMRLIIVSIKKSLTSVYYIVCILVLFILIFELLGMSLMNQNRHYQSFLEGFYTTYQSLTLQNWDELFIEMWPLNHFCFFYFVVWIFLGNYILFNLFISILVQSFGENETEEEDDLSEEELFEKLYTLPDYLYTIKNKIADKNLAKIHAQRKIVNREILNYKVNYSTTNVFTKSADIISKYSTSNILLNDSINEDNEKNENDELKSNIFSQVYQETYNEDNNIYNQKLKNWQKINKLFKNNDCENSLFFIPQENGFRIFCMELINKKSFDNFILLIITLSTIRLISDTFINGYTSVLAFDILDTVFNFVFLMEALFKICAMGFCFDDGSYIRDNWNKIDALIVCCSFVEYHNILQKYFYSNDLSNSVEFLQVLRLLRTLRPLRFISHNAQLKLVITSLFDSIFSIINALFILIVVLFMFSIIGISLFYSHYHDCYVLKSNGIFNLATDSFNNMLAEYEIKNDITLISSFCADKYNGVMDTGPTFKFSNIKTAFITSYILSTMEEWPNIMNSYRVYSEYYGIYFIVFNLVVAYFFLNLFTGILFKYFNEAYKKEQKIAKDDKKAPKYYDFLTQIMGAQSDYIIWNKPMKGTFKYFLRKIVDSDIFENIIMVLIFLNMIVMALTYEGCSENYSNFLKSFNYLFNFIFMFECLLKLIAYGIKPYFYSSWNKFDFVIVMVSILDIVIADIDGIDASFLKTFQIIRVLKVIRVIRVIRLVKILKELEKLIQTFQWSFSALVNILILMILIFSIIALIGCYLYDGDRYENYKDKFAYINEYYNFDNFYSAYLLIFRCSTGENWNNIMEEMAYRNEGKEEAYSFAFFILSNFFTAIILLNLLLMVTLQQYDEFRNKKYNPIDKFNSFLADFNNAWNKFSTEEDSGFRIKKYLVSQFFMELNWRKLNFPEKGKLESIKKYISDLKLYIDMDDYVYYHDVVFKIIYKQMGSQIDRSNPENNLIFKTEKILQKKIKNIINKYASKKLKNDQKNILISFNPLTSYLYYKLSFQYLKAFINYYKENMELLQHLEESKESELFNSSEDSDSSNQNDKSSSESGSSRSSSSNDSNSNSNSKKNSSSGVEKEDSKNNSSLKKEENSN